MNPFDPEIFATENPCVCCNQPAECACALLIPPGNIAGPSAYPSYSDASDAISNFTADCLVYAFASNTLDSLSASFNGTDLALSGQASFSGGSSGIELYASISALSGSTLHTDYSAAFTGDDSGPEIGYVLYDCNWNQVDNHFSSDLSGSFETVIPGDGVYYLYVTATAEGEDTGPATSALSTTTTCDNSIVANPVIALWDDSGTTRKLWACPKLLLPLLTESTGDWYADCAAVSDIFYGVGTIQVSNCVGYIDMPSSASIFTATDGGTSLSLDGAVDNGDVDPRFDMWGGINLVVGDILSVAFSLSGTHSSATVAAILYDDSGVLVESKTSVSDSGTLVFSSAPYSGRYTLRCRTGRNDGVATDSLSGGYTITSSGTMTVNPIAAAYDAGLTCPAYLNCGDSCP